VEDKWTAWLNLVATIANIQLNNIQLNLVTTTSSSSTRQESSKLTLEARS